MRIARIASNINNVPNSLKIPDDPSHFGGEARLFVTTDDKYAVKVYHKSTPDKKTKLKEIIFLGKNLGEDTRHTAWPLAVVTHIDDQQCTGVVTRYVPFPSLEKLILTPHNAHKQFKQGISWLNYLKIARAISAATRSIHGRGVTHGDISSKNILSDIRSGEATLIDLDGIIIPGWFEPQVRGTPKFMAPELYEEIAKEYIAKQTRKSYKSKVKPSMKTDIHSLTVTILWVLLFRNVMNPQVCYDDEDHVLDDALGFGKFSCFSENPNDRRNWFRLIGQPFTQGGYPSYRILSPRLQLLTEQAFIHKLKKPNERPTAREWEIALSECYDLLKVCTRCKQTMIYPYWIKAQSRKCPFCSCDIRPPFPIVLKLLEERVRGEFLPIRIYNVDGNEKFTPISLEHNSPLFEDVIKKDSIAPFTRRGTQIVGITLWDKHQGIYVIRNETNEPWNVIMGGSRTIRRGETVALKRGRVLSFGEGKRMAQVLG